MNIKHQHLTETGLSELVASVLNKVTAILWEISVTVKARHFTG